MMKTAFLFPGQGSQSVGMGASLLRSFPETQTFFDQANEILGWDLLQVFREGPEDRLRQTQVAQPALYVTGFVTAQILRSRGAMPVAAAGHSIGEYAALAVADVFTFSDGMRLVKERGRLMQEAGQANPGSMVAIVGLSPEQVGTLCEKAGNKGICVAVNLNSPEQTVIAGEKQALEEASRLASEAGAKRVIPLNVAGAFHSPLMKEAASAMKEHLKTVAFKDPSIPVAMNVDGRLHQKGPDIQSQLALQLDHPVQWVLSMEALIENGCTRFVESGNGRVLTGLMRRINKAVEVFSTESTEALIQTAEALGASKRGIS